MIKSLTITVRRVPDDPGFRAEASGDPAFDAAFAEYGEHPRHAIGGLIQSLADMGALDGPVKINLVLEGVYDR